MGKSAAIVNYQNRGAEFSAGDVVYPFFGSSDQSGRVLAVWPAIGMVDVQWPHGAERIPVEDLQRLTPDVYYQPPMPGPGKDDVPGGLETVPVSYGPAHDMDTPEVNRVAAAFTKKGLWEAHQMPDFKRRMALYWANKDRRYRARQTELVDGNYMCPKCKDVALRKATYKRRNGESVRLLGCPSCLFLIKREDILGDPNYIEVEVTASKRKRGV